MKPWLTLSFAAALIATAMDAVLMQQRRSFFTGGFLSVDHVTSAAQGAEFLLASFLIDFAVLGAAAAVVLPLCARLRLSRTATATIAAAVVLTPIAVANFVEYQLIAYLGDAFDFQLMFDLAGRSAGEVLAVSWPQIARAGLAIGVVVFALAALVWVLGRRSRGVPRPGRVLPPGASVALVLALLAFGSLLELFARSASDVLDNGLRRKPAGRFLGALVNVASDVDRDGFGLLGRPPDPDLFDAGVKPYALDVPGNGIDENGIGGDLPGAAAPYREPRIEGRVWTSTPDVVLVVLESFRADAFGAAVEGRPVTPNLDALAAAGVAARQAYSHNGYTVQSRRHIFTGSVADIQGRTTLLDDFKANGYQTAYFSAQDESFGGAGQGIGFERADVSYDARADRDRRYSSFSTPGSLAVSHQVLNARVNDFLAHGRTRQPLFLYVNFHDTHFPYHHQDIEPLLPGDAVPQSGIVPSEAARVRAMYLNTAANVDKAIGTLLARVRMALGHDPAVIVLSDHGESLFDEGFLGHGYALNDAQTRIPLIAAGLPLAIEEPFGQADLRTLIGDALSGDPAAVPSVRRNPDRRVFQYLGNITTPAQIGFETLDGRILFDLRSRLARIGGGGWKAEAGLTPAERGAVLDLIHTWERMLLAREQSS